MDKPIGGVYISNQQVSYYTREGDEIIDHIIPRTFHIRQENGRKKKVSSKEYYNHSLRLLQNSVYPTQTRNYFMLTIPSDTKDKKTVPVDYLLTNIVLLLWENKLYTKGWDQGEPGEYATIGMKKMSTDGHDTREVLAEIFGRKNVVLHPEKIYSTPIKDPSILSEYQNRKPQLVNEKPTKIHIFTDNWNTNIWFKHDYLKQIHKDLGLKMPRIEDSLPGFPECVYNGVAYGDFLQFT